MDAKHIVFLSLESIGSCGCTGGLVSATHTTSGSSHWRLRCSAGDPLCLFWHRPARFRSCRALCGRLCVGLYEVRTGSLERRDSGCSWMLRSRWKQVWPCVPKASDTYGIESEDSVNTLGLGQQGRRPVPARLEALHHKWQHYKKPFGVTMSRQGVCFEFGLSRFIVC